ncbi:UDP-glucose 4-epimerase-like [Oppia nitens]|uniref:UDP-glucose 4-epimerase-like n=1 Tax=Oppia nitens TaxID=1686743 RepID=UPI0023DCD147|nr:UDP-glucose 4-epimerase-like [Oppia nitens]
MSKLILVTGGAGYVGSHCVLEFLNKEYNVIVIDNLVNSTIINGNGLPESLIRVQHLTGKKLKQFIDGDLRDSELLDSIFSNNNIDVVIHFAGLKAVGESIAKPLLYYDNNITGTINLLKSMEKFKVNKLVFSSSSTVYGEPEELPITEHFPTGQNCTNPYGRTKYMLEEIMKDLCVASPDWSIMSLRYFNPVGAHFSADIGEQPNGEPKNLMPYITQVAVGVRKELKVFGNDYKTSDGTCIRDYLHIEDLAVGHLKAIDKIYNNNFPGFHAINLGTGRGYTVLEVIQAFKMATGVKIAYKIVDRRPGDACAVYADARLAHEVIGWKATRGLQDMCSSAWKWQQKNPNGYRSKVK